MVSFGTTPRREAAQAASRARNGRTRVRQASHRQQVRLQAEEARIFVSGVCGDTVLVGCAF